MRPFKRVAMQLVAIGIGLLAYRMLRTQHPTPEAAARHLSSQAEATKSKRDVGSVAVRGVASKSARPGADLIAKSAGAYLRGERSKTQDWMDATLRPYTPVPVTGATEIRYAGTLLSLHARSPEEARWMAERGYPEYMEYSDASSGHGDLLALANKAAQGDLTALGLLGVAQFKFGQVEAGQANLEEAAARGSVFALIALGLEYSRSPEPERMVQSVALHNLAVMRGDYQAGRFGFGVRRAFTQDMAYDAQILAMRYWQNLNAYRASIGLPPLDSTMRPGFGVEQPPGSMEIPVFAHGGG